MLKLNGKRLRELALLLTMLVSIPGFAETIRVTGSVTDVEGEPLIGASVVDKNKPGTGVVTDIDGRYAISIEKGSTLQVSYVGFQTEEFKVTSTRKDFVLKEETSGLNEVVVTGFARQKKISVIGSQATLKMEEVKSPVANMTTVLAGRVAGVVSVQRTGLPGQDDADIWKIGRAACRERVFIAV